MRIVGWKSGWWKSRKLWYSLIFASWIYFQHTKKGLNIPLLLCIFFGRSQQNCFTMGLEVGRMCEYPKMLTYLILFSMAVKLLPRNIFSPKKPFHPFFFHWNSTSSSRKGRKKDVQTVIRWDMLWIWIEVNNALWITQYIHRHVFSYLINYTKILWIIYTKEHMKSIFFFNFYCLQLFFRFNLCSFLWVINAL